MRRREHSRQIFVDFLVMLFKRTRLLLKHIYDLIMLMRMVSGKEAAHIQQAVPQVLPLSLRLPFVVTGAWVKYLILILHLVILVTNI